MAIDLNEIKLVLYSCHLILRKSLILIDVGISVFGNWDTPIEAVAYLDLMLSGYSKFVIDLNLQSYNSNKLGQDQ